MNNNNPRRFGPFDIQMRGCEIPYLLWSPAGQKKICILKARCKPAVEMSLGDDNGAKNSSHVFLKAASRKEQ